MSTSIGNLFGMILLIAAGLTGLVSAQVAGIACVSVQYVILAIMLLADVFTKPSDAVAITLHPNLKETFRRYHLFIKFPNASSTYSALLNILRLGGTIFIIAMLYYGHYIIAGFLGAYFFLTAPIITKMSPFLYMGPAAEKGNQFATEELKRIEILIHLLYHGESNDSE